MTKQHKIAEVNTMESNDVWSEYPAYGRYDWKVEVMADQTNLGYWDWVRHQIESDAE